MGRMAVTGPAGRRVDHSPFGEHLFGRMAERFARAFGTPTFIIGQTLVVIVWIAWNVAGGG